MIRHLEHLDAGYKTTEPSFAFQTGLLANARQRPTGSSRHHSGHRWKSGHQILKAAWRSILNVDILPDVQADGVGTTSTTMAKPIVSVNVDALL